MTSPNWMVRTVTPGASAPSGGGVARASCSVSNTSIEIPCEWAARSDLEADDSLAAQAATAEVVQYLRGVGECNGGPDTCGNRAVREHLSDFGQSLRRYQ